MMHFKSIYSKTYTDQNRTLLVDNVKYQLGNNKKTMIRANRIHQSTIKTSINLASTYNKNSFILTRSIINKNRILRENNHQFNSFKSFRRAKKSKFKFIFKKPTNQFKLNKTSRVNGFEKAYLYKKIYNNEAKSEQMKTQIQQMRKKSVKSSINCLVKKNKNKSNKLKLSTINTTYCMFFCRFGKCAKIDTCQYRHDKDKVAVCKNFLKGKCEIKGCLLSHKIDQKKMPVCSFFLKGICNSENSNCPYRHVNVSTNAEICKDFVRGFCNQGDQCKLLHQYAKLKCTKCKNESNSLRPECECKVEKNRNHSKAQSMSILKRIDRSKDRLAKSIEPDLIEIINSDSNMEISDDDICLDKNDEIANCIDFIPLTKDYLDVPVEEQARDAQSIKQSTNESNDNPNATDEHLSFDYDSDDTWFDPEGSDGKTEFFQFIPGFLLN